LPISLKTLPQADRVLLISSEIEELLTSATHSRSPGGTPGHAMSIQEASKTGLLIAGWCDSQGIDILQGCMILTINLNRASIIHLVPMNELGKFIHASNLTMIAGGKAKRLSGTEKYCYDTVALQPVGQEEGEIVRQL